MGVENRAAVGTVVAAPDGTGMGTVSFGDATRLVYFDPLRYVDPWPVPAPGDRVTVATGTATAWHALWLLGRGTPTYTGNG